MEVGGRLVLLARRDVLPAMVDAAVDERVVGVRGAGIGRPHDLHLDEPEEAAIAEHPVRVSVVVHADQKPEDSDRQPEADRPQGQGEAGDDRQHDHELAQPRRAGHRLRVPARVPVVQEAKPSRSRIDANDVVDGDADEERQREVEGVSHRDAFPFARVAGDERILADHVGPKEAGDDHDERILDESDAEDERGDEDVEEPADDAADRHAQVEIGQVPGAGPIAGELAVTEHRHEGERRDMQDRESRARQGPITSATM